MKKRKNENTFLVVWSFCVVILLFMCLSSLNFSLKGTNAYFGGGTTGTFDVYDVYYYSNYPEGTFDDVEPIKDNQNSNYNKLLDNMFEVPDGYEFVSWKDENGVEYLPNDVKFLNNDSNMYAQWRKIDSDENDEDTNDNEGDDSDVAYGDVNLNGEIDSDDYLLVENHVNGISILGGNALVNADVNVDGKVDLIDVDIIKNAYLGTKNYVGYLPNNPILIYDIYEGNIDAGEGELGDEDNPGDGSINGGGTGNGTSGAGGGTSGGGNGNNSGGGTGDGNSNGSQASGGGNDGIDGKQEENEDEELEKDEIVDIEPRYYDFKYMNGKKEFATTKCEAVNGVCEIILPNNEPVRSGYTFKGWSLNKDCSGDNIINASIMVKSGNTYYACYLKNVDEEKSDNKYYVWIIVFAISALSIRLIWHLIYKFRNDENNSKVDE